MPSRQSKTRQRIIDAMPGSQKEIAIKIGIDESAVNKWLRRILESKDAHITATVLPDKGRGRLRNIYAAGPEPEGFVLKKYEPLTKEQIKQRNAERMREVRVQSTPKPHILNALFGK